jgi:predicted DCC family thiol-disulfide oxidoreductase YuxK
MNTLLTLYYDGNCPFCATEMARLRKWDKLGHLGFVDIADAAFDPTQLGVEMADLQRELHGLTRSGTLLIGVDTILAAYTLVRRGYLVWPLRVPALRPALSPLYRLFARHRLRISDWLGYRPTPRCDGQHCSINHPFFDK